MGWALGLLFQQNSLDCEPSGSITPSLSTAFPCFWPTCPLEPTFLGALSAQPDLYLAVPSSQGGHLALHYHLVFPCFSLHEGGLPQLPATFSCAGTPSMPCSWQHPPPTTSHVATWTHPLWRLCDFPAPSLAPRKTPALTSGLGGVASIPDPLPSLPEPWDNGSLLVSNPTASSVSW